VSGGKHENITTVDLKIEKTNVAQTIT